MTSNNNHEPTVADMINESLKHSFDSTRVSSWKTTPRWKRKLLYLWHRLCWRCGIITKDNMRQKLGYKMPGRKVLLLKTDWRDER